MVYRVTWENDGSHCIPCCEGSHACCTLRVCTCECSVVLSSLAVMQRLTNEQELAYEQFLDEMLEARQTLLLPLPRPCSQ